MSLTSNRAGVPTIVGGVYTSSSPSPMNDQGCALQVDDQGNLLVNVAVGGGGGGGGNVTVVGPLGQALSAASVPVVLPAAQITALTAPTAAAIASAIVANPPTTPVTGSVSVSNFPTTQAVSLASAPTTPVTGTFFQATQPVSGTVTVTPPTLTKATQGATGFSTQDLKDAGRNYVILYAQLLTGVTTEALATFTKNVAGTTTTGQTAYTISSGKTFRIQALSVAILNTTTVANSCTYNVRAAASVAASSPIVASCGCSSVGAVSGQHGFATLPIPDGMELAGNGTLQIGVSHLENVTTASISSFTLIGYEY